MAKRRADKELTDRNWDQEDEPEEAGEIELASSDKMKGRMVLKGKRRDTGPTQNKEFSGFSGFSFKPTAASTPFSFNVRSVTNGSAEKDAEQKEKTSENGQTKLAPPSNGAGKSSPEKKKSSYLSSLKNLNESVLAWIKSHVDKNPYCILTPVFKDYEKHLSEIMKSKDAEKTEIVSKDEKSNETTKSTESTFNSLSKFATKGWTCDACLVPNKEDADKCVACTSAKPKASSSSSFKFGNSLGSVTTGPKSSETGFKAQTTTVSSASSFSFGNALTSTTTSSVTASKPLGTGAMFGSTFGTSTTTSGFSGFGFKPSTDLGKPASGFSFGAMKPKETEGSASQEEDDEYVPPAPESKEVPEDGSVYSIKCKLFYQKDGTWTERGVGFLHLKPSDGKLQMVVRADTTLGNIILNIILSPSIPLQRQGKNNVNMICVANPPVDKKADPAKPVSMLIRVKTGEDADQLLEKMEEYRKAE